MLHRLWLAALALVLSFGSALAIDQSAAPPAFNIPWASSAGSAFITYPTPQSSQIGITNCAASLTDGFPLKSMQSVASGGCAPFGQDINGILKQVTLWNQWTALGGPSLYNSTLSSSVGGYPKGALLTSASVVGCYWISQADNNTSDPDTGGANWTAFCTTGAPGILYATQQASVSGSSQNTTGTISGSSHTLALGSALDFLNGQGIRVNHAGAGSGLSAPSGCSVTPQGTPGLTAYAYVIVAISATGGYSAPVTVSTSTGAATLTGTNYNYVACDAASAPTVGYAVYGNKSGTENFQIISVFTSLSLSYGDTGLGSSPPPDYWPSAAPGSGAADWLVTTISTGAGTTSL